MNLNVRRIRLLLWTASALAGLGSVVSIAAGLWLPCAVLTPTPLRTAGTSSSPATSTGQGAADLAALEPIMTLDLRRPLYDTAPAAVAPEPPPPPPPPLTVRLAGTIIEPGHNLAMLITGDGKIGLRGVGQSSGGAEILAIEHDSVTVTHNGRNLTLSVEKEGEQPG